jgi:aminoglycoside 6'-N-acetyltransferase
MSPMSPIPELLGELVTLRPTTPADAADLHRILATPEIERWWRSWDLARVEAELTGGDDEIEVLGIVRDGRLVGSIQFHEETESEYRHAGIDLFLDPAFHRQGLGTDAIRTLARYLIEGRGHHRLTIDPATGNHAAIAAYAKVGFRAVGVMRRYELGQDGTWHDGLLMDLLADELR